MLPEEQNERMVKPTPRLERSPSHSGAEASTHHGLKNLRIPEVFMTSLHRSFGNRGLLRRCDHLGNSTGVSRYLDSVIDRNLTIPDEFSGVEN